MLTTFRVNTLHVRTGKSLLNSNLQHLRLGCHVLLVLHCLKLRFVAVAAPMRRFLPNRKCGAESFICVEVLEYPWPNKQYPTLVLEHGARMPPWSIPIQSDECDCSPCCIENFPDFHSRIKAITLSSTNIYATPWIATTKL